MVFLVAGYNLETPSEGMVRNLKQQQKDEVKEHDGCQKETSFRRVWVLGFGLPGPSGYM